MRKISERMKWILGAFVLFLMIYYWEKAINVGKMVLGAAFPLLLGCAIAYCVNIILRFYESGLGKFKKIGNKSGIKRACGIILAYLTFIALIGFILLLVLPELINCITSLGKAVFILTQSVLDVLKNNVEFGNYVTAFEQEFRSNFANYEEKLMQAVNVLLNGVGGMLSSAVSALSSIFSGIITVLVSVIFSIYLLIEKENLQRQSQKLIRIYIAKYAEKIFYVFRILDESFHTFIVGQCVEAVILGSLCIAGMLLFRFPYAVMIGTFIGFTALIPVAGAYIGAIVGVLMIATVSPVKAALFILFIIVLQQLEGNLIYPKVVGTSIGLPGIWVLAAITIGGGTFGVIGMLFAVPLVAALYKFIKLDTQKRTKKIVDKNKKAAKV